MHEHDGWMPRIIVVIACRAAPISLQSICETGARTCWWLKLRHCGMRCGRNCNGGRFISMPGSCCRTICIANGRCRRATRIFPGACARSRPDLPGGSHTGPRGQSGPRGKRESGIWQRRFWEHTIRDERDYAAHMDYIHFNPVKHGLVAEARAWEYSSFRRCVAAGLYPAEWGRTAGDAVNGGERE